MVNSKIQAAEENLIHVYNRFPIALDHGEGMNWKVQSNSRSETTRLWIQKEKNILTLQQDLLCQDLDMIIKN